MKECLAGRRPGRAAWLLAALLAGATTSRAVAQSPADSVLRSYWQSMLLGNWERCAGLVDPGEVRRVRSLLTRAFEAEPSFRTALLGSESLLSVDDLTDAGFYAKALAGFVRVTGQREVLANISDIEIAGDVVRPGDSVIVVYRSKLKDGGNVPLRSWQAATMVRVDGVWKVAFMANFDGLLSSARLPKP